MEEEVRFIGELPPTSWLKTLDRLSVLKAYEVEEHRTSGAAETYARRLGMTARSFYRLLRAYEAFREAGTAKRPGSGRPRWLSPEVDRFIDETIARFGREVPDRAVYLEVERLCRGAGIEPPSYKAVRERIVPSSVDLRIRLARRADVVLDVCPLDLDVTTEDEHEVAAHLAHLSALILAVTGATIGHVLTAGPPGFADLATVLASAQAARGDDTSLVTTGRVADVLEPHATVLEALGFKLDPVASRGLKQGSAIRPTIGSRIGRLALLPMGRPAEKDHAVPLLLAHAVVDHLLSSAEAGE